MANLHLELRFGRSRAMSAMRSVLKASGAARVAAGADGRLSSGTGSATNKTLALASPVLGDGKGQFGGAARHVGAGRLARAIRNGPSARVRSCGGRGPPRRPVRRRNCRSSLARSGCEPSLGFGRGLRADEQNVHIPCGPPRPSACVESPACRAPRSKRDIDLGGRGSSSSPNFLRAASAARPWKVGERRDSSEPAGIGCSGLALIGA